MIGAPFWQALATTAFPVVLLLIPAIAIVRQDDFRDLLGSSARAFLWSIGSLIILSFLAAAVRLPLYYAVLTLLAVFIFAVIRRRRELLQIKFAWVLMGIITPIILLYAAFAIPYFLRLDGLPTGDSQKAIYWGQVIIETGGLPLYSTAIDQLNRDPGDFFTPGLHAVTATVMQMASQPLVSVGLFAIVLAIATAWIAATIYRELFSDNKQAVVPLVAGVFALTNFRFLRYLREPGYHYQNVVGEFLLFGLLYLCLRLLKKFRWADAILAALLGVALILSHQFTVFVGFFMLLPLVVIYVANHRSRFVQLVILAGIGALALLAIPFGLYQKIPHLFTFDTHLAGLVPELLEYPMLLGPVWLVLGVTGLVSMGYVAWSKRNHVTLGFVISAVVPLLLSQGPRFFLDIPPVRALLYAVIPLSVCAAYTIVQLQHILAKSRTRTVRYALTGVLLLILLLPAYRSVQAAFAGSRPNAPTNSTLTAEQVYLADFIARNITGGVLIDDRNRRSDSWLILGGQPMYTRLTSDLGRQMLEAGQSELRKVLYLRQLAFEKAYMLASHPAASYALSQQNIAVVAGVHGSSEDGFKHNATLQEIARGGKTTLFAPIETTYLPDMLDMWLLRTSTLVNDIGDREDTYPHLPASIQSHRLSSPQLNAAQTFRTTSAPIISLSFNIGDYVRVLWDQEQTNKPDTDGQLLITTAFGPSELKVSTATGATYTVTPGAPAVIAAADLPFEDDGTVRIDVLNSEETLIGIDMIALGLTNVP